MAKRTRVEKIEKITNDPIYFLSELWDDRKLNTVAPLSDLELDIVQYALTGPTNRGILAPRGIGKTHLVSAVATSFRLYRDPNRKVLIPSKSNTHAKKVVGIIRKWIDEVWFLKHLKPGPGQVDSATQFQVGPAVTSLQPSVTAIGIGGQLEGNRAHSIFPDDVETKENTETLDAREGLDERVKEFGVILYPDEIMLGDDGEVTQNAVDPVEICYVGTYHAIPVEESLYVKLSQRGYEFRTWPVASPSRTDKLLGLAPMIAEGLGSGKYKWTEGDNYEQNPLFPKRFNSKKIANERKQGRVHFDMQFMLKCELGEEARFPLRLNDIIVYPCQRDEAPIHISWAERTGALNMLQKGKDDGLICEDITHLGFAGDRLHRPLKIDTTFAPYAGTKAFIDPAGKGDDEMGLGIVAQLNGFLWVKAVEGYARGLKDIDAAVILCRDWGVNEIWFESNIDVFDSFGQMLRVAVQSHCLEPGQNAMFPNGWKCHVQSKHSAGQSKEKRIIRILDPVFSRHRVVIDPSAIAPKPGVEIGKHLHLQEQITRITHQPKCLKRDDKIDVLAGAIDLWTDLIGVNTEDAADRKRHDIARDELLELEGGWRKRRRKPASWINRV